MRVRFLTPVVTSKPLRTAVDALERRRAIAAYRHRYTPLPTTLWLIISGQRATRRGRMWKLSLERTPAVVDGLQEG
jgi:hypothetical protein